MENDYDKSPIEGFGKKILLQQGWFQGRGLGKLSTGEIVPYSNYILRSERSGLGSDKELIKKQLSSLIIGSEYQITRGRHRGIKGTLVSIDSEIAKIEIPNNTNTFKVPIQYLKPGEVAQEVEKKTEARPLKWVVPSLIVRIRSKHAHKGSLYGCKGKIEDVISESRFTININNKIYEDLLEKDLETVIPATNSTVLIVKGSQKGETCKLLSRDRSKNVVTLEYLQEIIFLKQDDICEFIPNS